MSTPLEVDRFWRRLNRNVQPVTSGNSDETITAATAELLTAAQQSTGTMAVTHSAAPQSIAQLGRCTNRQYKSQTAPLRGVRCPKSRTCHQ